MKIDIDEKNEAVITAAMASGAAESPQAFINGLIGRYCREPKTQAELEAMLDEAAGQQGVSYESIDALRNDLHAGYTARSQDRPA